MSTAVEGRLNITPAPSIYTTEVTDSNVRELRRSFSRFEEGSATVTNFVATPNPLGISWWNPFTSESDILFKSGKLKSLTVSLFEFDRINQSVKGTSETVRTFQSLQAQAKSLGVAPDRIRAHEGVTQTADGRATNEEILHWKGEWGKLNQQSISEFIAKLKEGHAAARIPTEQATLRTGMFTGLAVGDVQLTGSGGFINERAGKIGGTYKDYAFTTDNPYINKLVKQFEAGSRARQGVYADEANVPGFSIRQNESIYAYYNDQLANYLQQIKESRATPEQIAGSGSKVVIASPAMSLSESSISDSDRDLNQRQLVLQYVNTVTRMADSGVPVYLKVDPQRIDLPSNMLYELVMNKNVYFMKSRFLDQHAHHNTTYAELNLGGDPKSFVGTGTYRPVGGHSLNFAWISELRLLGEGKDGKQIVNPEYYAGRRIIDEIFSSNYAYQPRRDPALEDGGLVLQEFYTPTFKDRQSTGFLEGGHLPYMPTLMPEAFFSYYEKGTKTHMYTHRYQAVYRRDPEGLQAYILGTMDRKLSDPGFGMLLNMRVGQNDLYVPGEGLIGAATNALGRFLDTVTGFYTFQTIKAQQRGDLYGSVSKYYDKSQTDPYENRKSRGFFENFLHSAVTTLSGTAVSMAAYFGVTHGYNIAKAEIEGVGVQSVLQALQSGHDTPTTKIFTSQLLSRPHQEILEQAGAMSRALSLSNRGEAIKEYFLLVQDVILDDVMAGAGLTKSDALVTRLGDERLTDVIGNIRTQLTTTNAESVARYLNDDLRQELLDTLSRTHTDHDIKDVFRRGFKKLDIDTDRGIINLGHTFSASITGVNVTQLSGFTNLAAVRRMDISNINQVFVPLLMEIADVRMGEADDFDAAINSLRRLAKQPPLLDYLRLDAPEGERSQFAIFNYGFERIENLARTLDEIAKYIPANPFMWYKPFRDAFGSRKTIPSMTDGEVDATTRGSFRQLIGPGFAGLLDLTKQVGLAVQDMRTSGVGQHLRDTFDTFATQRDIRRRELELIDDLKGQDARRLLASLGGTSFDREFEALQSQMGVLTKQVSSKHVSKMNFQHLDSGEGAFRNFRKTFFSIGTFLLADKLLDTYVFRPQGADLFDTIMSDIFGTPAPKSRQEGYEDDSRYKGLYETHYSSGVPAAVKYPAAALGYYSAGYLFPKVYTEEHELMRFVRGSIGEADLPSVMAALSKKGVAEGAAISKIRFSGKAGLLGAAAGLIASQLLTSYLANTIKPAAQAIGSLMTGRYRKYKGGLEIDPIYGTVAAGLADIVSSSKQRRARSGYQDSPSERAAVHTLNMYVQQFVKPRLTPGRTFYPFATQMAFPFFQFTSVAKIDPKGNKIDLESGLQLFPLLGVGMMIPFPATPQVKYSNGLVAQQLYTRLNQIPNDVIAPYRQLTTASQAEYESAQRIRALADVAGIMLGSWLNVSFDHKPLIAIAAMGALGSSSRKLEGLVRGLPSNSRLRAELENYRTLYNVTKLGVRATDSLVRGAFSLTTIVSNALIKSTTSLLGVGGGAMVRSGPMARALAPYYLSAMILGGLIKPTQEGSETELGGVNDVLLLFNRGQYEGAAGLYQLSLANQIIQTGVGTAIFGSALAQSGAFDRAADFRNVTGTDFISRKKQAIFSYWEDHLTKQGKTVDYAISRMAAIRDKLRGADRITAPVLLEELHKLELPLLRSAPARYAMAARKVAPLLIGFTAAAQVLALTDFYKNPYLTTLIKAVSDTGRGDWSAEQRAFLSSIGIRGMRYQPKNVGDAARNVLDYLWSSVTFFANNPANVYQDPPNPFLGVLGPLGVSSQQDQARYYFQSQSVAADLSGSLYIMPAMVSDMTTSLELGPALRALSKAPSNRVNGVSLGGLQPKTATALIRGAAIRKRPARIRGGIDQSDIGAVTTPELYMALSRRSKEVQRLTMQSANQHMQDIVRVFALAGRIAGPDRDAAQGPKQPRANTTIYDSILSSARLVGWTNSALVYAKLGTASQTSGDLIRGLRAMGSRLAGYGQGAIEAQSDLGQTLYGDRVQDAGPNPIFGYFAELFKFAFGTFYDPNTGVTGTESNNLAGAVLMAGGATVLASAFVGSSMATLIQMLGAAAALGERGTIADLAGNVDQMNRNISRRLYNTVYFPDEVMGQVVGIYRQSNRNRAPGYRPIAYNAAITRGHIQAVNQLYSGGLLENFANADLKDQAMRLARETALDSATTVSKLSKLDTEINRLRTVGGMDIRKILNPDLTETLADTLFTNEKLNGGLIEDIVALHEQGKTLEAREYMIWNRLQQFFFNQLDSEQFGHANAFTAQPPTTLGAAPKSERSSRAAAKKVVPAWDTVVNREAQYINELIDQKGYSGLLGGSVQGAFTGLAAAMDFKAGYEVLSYSAAALADSDATSRRRASIAASYSLLQTFGLILPAQVLLKGVSKHPLLSMGIALGAGVIGAYAFADQRFGTAVGNLFRPIFNFSDKHIIRPTANSLAALIEAASNTPLALIGHAVRPVTQFIDPLFTSIRSSVYENPILNSLTNYFIPETVDSFYSRLAVRPGAKGFWGARAEMYSQEELGRYRRARAKARRQRASIRNAGIDSDLVSPFLLGRSAGEDNAMQSMFLRRYLGGDGRVMESFTTEAQLSTLMKGALEQRQGELDQYAVGTSYLRAPHIRRNAYQMAPIVGGLMRYSYAASGAYFKSPMILSGRIAQDTFGLYSEFANLLGRVPHLRSGFAGLSLGLLTSSMAYKQDPRNPNWVAPFVGMAGGAAIGYTMFPRASAFLEDQAWWARFRTLKSSWGQGLNNKGAALSNWFYGLRTGDTLRALGQHRSWVTPALGTGMLATAAIYSNYDALMAPLAWFNTKRRRERQEDSWLTRSLVAGGIGFGLTGGSMALMTYGRTRAATTAGFGEGLQNIGGGAKNLVRFASVQFLINQAMHLPYLNAIPFGLYEYGVRPLFSLNPEDTEANYNTITQGVSTLAALAITSRQYTYGRFVLEPKLARAAQTAERNARSLVRSTAFPDLGQVQTLEEAIDKSTNASRALTSYRDGSLFNTFKTDLIHTVKAAGIVTGLTPVLRGVGALALGIKRRVGIPIRWGRKQYRKVPAGVRRPISEKASWLRERFVHASDHFFDNPLYGATDEMLEGAAKTPSRFAALSKVGSALFPYAPTAIDLIALGAGAHQISNLKYGRTSQDFQSTYSSFYSSLGAITMSSLMAAGGRSAGFLRAMAGIIQGSRIGAEQGARIGSDRFFDAYEDEGAYMSSKRQELLLGSTAVALSIGGSTLSRQYFQAGAAARYLSAFGNIIPGAAQIAVSSYDLLRFGSSYNQQFRRGDTAQFMAKKRSGLLSGFLYGAGITALGFRSSGKASWLRTIAAGALFLGGFAASAGEANLAKEQYYAFRRAGITDDYTQNLIQYKASESIIPGGVIGGLVGGALMAFATRGRSLGRSARIGLITSGVGTGMPLGGLLGYNARVSGLTNHYARLGLSPAEQADYDAWVKGANALPSWMGGSRQAKEFQRSRRFLAGGKRVSGSAPMIALASAPADTIRPEVLEAGLETIQRKHLDEQSFGLGELGFTALGIIAVGVGAMQRGGSAMLSTKAEKFLGKHLVGSLFGEAHKLVGAAMVALDWHQLTQSLNTMSSYRSTRGAAVDYKDSLAQMRTKAMDTSIQSTVAGIPGRNAVTDIAFDLATSFFLKGTEGWRRKLFIHDADRFLRDNKIQMTEDKRRRAIQSYSGAYGDAKARNIGLLVGVATTVGLFALGGFTLPALFLAGVAGAGLGLATAVTTADAIGNRRQQNVLLDRGNRDTGKVDDGDDMWGAANLYTGSMYLGSMLTTWGVGLAALKGYQETIKRHKAAMASKGIDPGGDDLFGTFDTRKPPSDPGGSGGSGVSQPINNNPGGDGSSGGARLGVQEPVSNQSTNATSATRPLGVVGVASTSQTVPTGTQTVQAPVSPIIESKLPNTAEQVIPNQQPSTPQILPNPTIEQSNKLEPTRLPSTAAEVTPTRPAHLPEPTSLPNPTVTQRIEIKQAPQPTPQELNTLRSPEVITQVAEVNSYAIQLYQPTQATSSRSFGVAQIPEQERSRRLSRVKMRSKFVHIGQSQLDLGRFSPEQLDTFINLTGQNIKTFGPKLDVLTKEQFDIYLNVLSSHKKAKSLRKAARWAAQQRKKRALSKVSSSQISSTQSSEVFYVTPSSLRDKSSVFSSKSPNDSRSLVLRQILGQFVGFIEIPVESKSYGAWAQSENAIRIRGDVQYDLAALLHELGHALHGRLGDDRLSEIGVKPLLDYGKERWEFDNNPEGKAYFGQERYIRQEAFAQGFAVQMLKLIPEDVSPSSPEMRGLSLFIRESEIQDSLARRDALPFFRKNPFKIRRLRNELAAIQANPLHLDLQSRLRAQSQGSTPVEVSTQRANLPTQNGGFIAVGGRRSNTPLDIFARAARQRMGNLGSTFLRGAGQELGFTPKGWSGKAFVSSQFNWLAIAGAGLTYLEETQVKGKSSQEALAETGKSLIVGLAAGAVIGGALLALGTAGAVIGLGLLAYGAYSLTTQALRIEAAVAKKHNQRFINAAHDYQGRLKDYGKGSAKTQSIPMPRPTVSNERRVVQRLTQRRLAGATYGMAKDRAIARVDPYRKAEFNQKKEEQKPWWQQLIDGVVGGAVWVGERIKSTAEWAAEQVGAAAQGVSSAVTNALGAIGISQDGKVTASDDLKLVMQMILAEAGGESFEGKVAVARVIVNRYVLKEAGSYSYRGSGVGFQPILDAANGGEFSPAWKSPRNNNYYRNKPVTPEAARALQIALSDDLMKQHGYDRLMDLTNFRVTSLSWRGAGSVKGPEVVIGNHKFMRDIYSVRPDMAELRRRHLGGVGDIGIQQGVASTQNVGGAVVLDVKTSYSGGGRAGRYHIDFAFNPNAGFSIADRVRMFEPVVQAYESMGRRIEFSNSRVAGLVYSNKLSQAEKERMMRRAEHAHTGRESGRNDYPIDFYVPLQGSPRYTGGAVTSSNVSGAHVPFVIPVIEGGYYTVGRFVPGAGQKITGYDAQGRWVYEAYHGEGGKVGKFYFSNQAQTATQNNPISGMNPAAMVEQQTQGRLTPEQLKKIPIARLQPLIQLLYKGEGGVDSVNVILRNSEGGRAGTRASTFQREFGRPASQVTLGEIRTRQRQTGSANGRSEVGAVGFPQFIGNTLQMAMDYYGYKSDTRFTKEVQENLFKYLIFIKRPEIGAYLLRNPGATIKEAQQGVAREFASMPLAYPEAPGHQLRASGTKIQTGWDVDRKRQTGQSLYYGIGGNNVRVDAGPLQRALENSRLDPASTAIPKAPIKANPVRDPLPKLNKRAYVSPDAQDRIINYVASAGDDLSQMEQAQAFLVEWTAALLKKAKDSKKETVIESIELPNTTAVNPKQYEQRLSKGMRTTKRETKAEVDEKLVLLTKVINQQMVMDQLASGGICDYESSAKKPRVTAAATA